MSKTRYQYEQPERIGESMTTARPWNRHALTGVELLNGRVAAIGLWPLFSVSVDQWGRDGQLVVFCAGICPWVIHGDNGDRQTSKKSAAGR